MKHKVIKILNSFDPNIEELIIKHLQIEGVLNLKRFKNLKVLDCSYNSITNIINIPDTIEDIDCSYNTLITVSVYMNNLTNLKMLNCMCNPDIRVIDNLPSSLTCMLCRCCKLIKIVIPPNMERLDCAYNNLNTLGILPDSLEYLDCRDNYIKKFKNKPLNITDTELADLLDKQM